MAFFLQTDDGPDVVKDGADVTTRIIPETAVIPGRRASVEPGIHNHDRERVP
jgi:hypothetical protein